MTKLQEYRYKAECAIARVTGNPKPSRPCAIEYNPQSKETGYRWVENVSKGLRVTPVHEVRMTLGHDNEYIERSPIDHTGWFLDPEIQDESVHGVVVQLPSHNRERRYAPGVSDPYNEDCVLVDFNSIISSLRQCTYMADDVAKKYAEDEQEYREAHRGDEE